MLLLLPLLLGAAVPSPEADYAARAAKLEGKKDAKAWLKLADFAEERLLWSEREEALRKAVEVDPRNAEAHERLDEVKVGKEWLPADEAEAKEAEEQQAKGLVFYGKGWIPSKEAGKLREADRKTVGWDLEFRLDTPHLTLYSGRPLPFTRRLAAILENEIGVYQKLYGKAFKLSPKPLTLRVYVFPDADTFARVMERDGVPPLTGGAGVYGNANRILYIGDVTGGSEAGVLVTAAHEMGHALDDIAADLHLALCDTALWLAEGRATHLGFGIHGRRILPGLANISPENAILNDLAKDIDGADVRKLMGLDQKAFCGQEIARNYALSWAWVHFLLHGEGGKHAAGFRAYLQGLPKKVSVADFEKAVGPLSGLEPAFKCYVKETLIPMARKAQEVIP